MNNVPFVCNGIYALAPEGATIDQLPLGSLLVPLSPGNGYDWDGSAWVINSNRLLSEAQAAQIAILRAACDAAMVAGFPSSALGAAHTYPSQPLDQSNLIGAVTTAGFAPSGWTVDFWCADSTGAWNNPPHTAAQIQQVLLDGTTAREALSNKLKGLVAQVMSPNATVASVQAVLW